MLTWFSHSRRAFTLIEMIIAMTIFGLMSTLTVLIYFHVSETSRRLQISRELSETSRQIVEYISQNIREGGVALDAPEFDPSTTHEPWRADFTRQYQGQGSEVLPVGTFSGSSHEKDDDTKWGDIAQNSTENNNAVKYFVYGKKEGNIFMPCRPEDQENIHIHCGLYLKSDDSYISLVDSFRPDESQKRVRITHLRFYISADDTSKVTLAMTLELMPRMGVPPSLIRGTRMHIQTTMSERFYRK